MGNLGGLLGRRKAEKKKTLKIFKNQKKTSDFGLFGLSWRTSWRPLGPSWRHLGAILAVLEGILGRLGGILEPSYPSWRPSWPSWRHLGGHLGPSWTSWRPSRAILEDFLRSLRSLAVLPGGRRDVPEPTGGVLLEKNQNQNRDRLARQAPL